MKIPLRTLAAASLLPLLAACGGAEGSATTADGPQVVAAFYPLEFVAERVAGDQAAVSTLTQPGQDSHAAELSFSQTAQVMEADVLVHLSGFQPVVDEAVSQSDAAQVVDAADAVELLPVSDEADEHADEAHAEDEHGHAHEGPLDLHFWTDPTRLAALAEPVAAALSDVDPDNAETYQANADALEEELRRLDRELTRGLGRCERDTVVVSHDAFGYLGERYGLDFHAIAGISPDAEPSPARLRELQDVARSEGVTTVFSERLASEEMAETLATDLGLQTAVLDPIEGLGDETADEDYISLMRDNLAALRTANGCR